jgi:hypothetical protein
MKLLKVSLISGLVVVSCGKPQETASGGEKNIGRGTIEVTARLDTIPEGAVFQRDLYDYATILKYEVTAVHRGDMEKGAVIYVGQYNPWKPRAEAADKRVKEIGGDLRQFRAGEEHRLALEAPMDEHYLGGIVDKYFGKHEGVTYWAVWTNKAK